MGAIQALTRYTAGGILAIILTVPAAAYEPKVRAMASEHSQAVYHLACLSGERPCTRGVFERFWTEYLPPDSGDVRHLRAWHEALRRIHDTAGPGDATPYLSNTDSLYPGKREQLRVIEALLDSGSSADFSRRSRLDAAAVAQLWQAVAHVRRRLARHWRARGRVLAERFLPASQRQLREPRWIRLAGEMADFISAGQPAREIKVQLIPSPALDDTAKASFVGRHLLLEVNERAKSELVVSVALHELTHHLYDSVPAAKQIERMEMFRQAGLTHGAAFYGLLNEALAVAAQGVLTSRLAATAHPKQDGDEYRHAYISRAGRVTGPLLAERLSRGEVFDASFVDAYIQRLTKELAGDITNPRLLFFSAAFLPTGEANKAAEYLRGEIQPGAWIQSGEFQRHSDLPLIFLGLSEQNRHLWESFPELEALDGARGYVFARTSPGARPVVIVGGRDSAALVQVATALMGLPSLPDRGAAVRLD